MKKRTRRSEPLAIEPQRQAPKVTLAITKEFLPDEPAIPGERCFVEIQTTISAR
jgi:hypothetical protein